MKRDINIIKAFKKEISLKTTTIKNKKKYNRKKNKLLNSI
jgi:hypothetical protein